MKRRTTTVKLAVGVLAIALATCYIALRAGLFQKTTFFPGSKSSNTFQPVVLPGSKSEEIARPTGDAINGVAP